MDLLCLRGVETIGYQGLLINCIMYKSVGKKNDSFLFNAVNHASFNFREI